MVLLTLPSSTGPEGVSVPTYLAVLVLPCPFHLLAPAAQPLAWADEEG